MARKKSTYGELKLANRKKDIQLQHVREDREMYKARAVEAERKVKEYEKVMEDYVFIDKKPEYFYSFSGGLFFKRWYTLNGITGIEAQFLVLLSYTDAFFRSTYKLFARNYIDKMPKIMPKLEEKGYVIKVPLPTKSAYRKRHGWVLTQKGKDFEADYEKYYDKKMEERKTGAFTPFTFEDGAYFRRVYVTRHQRRIEQGGGMLPKTGDKQARTFREQPIKNEEA